MADTYLMAGSLRLFGLTISAMRMPSVILSTLALIPFYFLARQWLSIRASLATTFLMASSLWYLHFSRSGWDNVHICLYATLAALMLTLALKKRRWYYYAASGFCAALGLYGYFSGRLIILAIMAFSPFAVWSNRRRTKQVAFGFLLVLATCIIAFAPQMPIIIRKWNYFNTRVRAVSIFNAERPYLGKTDILQIILHQIERTVKAFILNDSSFSGFGLNSRYIPPGRAFLDPVTAILFWIGLGLAIFRWRDTALWWCFFLVPLFTIQVFSVGTPDGARAIGAIPFIYLLYTSLLG